MGKSVFYHIPGIVRLHIGHFPFLILLNKSLEPERLINFA